MNCNLHFFLAMTADQKSAHKDLLAREKAIADERSAFVAGLSEHRDVGNAARLSHWNGKPVVEIIDDNRIRVTFGAYATEPEIPKPTTPVAPYQAPPEYVDPKILNALLHGKLLDDDEKKRLLSAVYPQAMKLATADGATPIADTPVTT